ncbi:TPA: carbohydrate-binding protein [Yersinia enterocolitica]
MSKIERYTGNLRAFGSNAQGLERTLFGEETQGDDLTSQVTNSFLRGWGIVGPSENPSMEDFNAAMYTMSQFIAYQHQMGIPEWDALQEYYSGSICVRNGEAYLSLVDSNIGSAPPSAKWTSVLTAKNALANLSGFLKSSNNLSEIKDAGPAAVAQTLLNLGLGDAAKRSVGTGVGQIPDMSSFISSFAQNGYFKFPGGLIIQWGEVTGSTTATVPTNFPIPFPNALMSTALAIDLIGPSYATLQNQTLSGISVNTWNSAGNRAALAIRYIAIGW